MAQMVADWLRRTRGQDPSSASRHRRGRDRPAGTYASRSMMIGGSALRARRRRGDRARQSGFAAHFMEADTADIAFCRRRPSRSPAPTGRWPIGQIAQMSFIPDGSSLGARRRPAGWPAPSSSDTPSFPQWLPYLRASRSIRRPARSRSNRYNSRRRCRPP